MLYKSELHLVIVDILILKEIFPKCSIESLIFAIRNISMNVIYSISEVIVLNILLTIIIL